MESVRTVKQSLSATWITQKHTYVCVFGYVMLRGTHLIMCGMPRGTQITLNPKLTYMITMGCVYEMHLKPVCI